MPVDVQSNVAINYSTSSSISERGSIYAQQNFLPVGTRIDESFSDDFVSYQKCLQLAQTARPHLFSSKSSAFIYR